MLELTFYLIIDFIYNYYQFDANDETSSKSTNPHHACFDANTQSGALHFQKLRNSHRPIVLPSNLQFCPPKNVFRLVPLLRNVENYFMRC